MHYQIYLMVLLDFLYLHLNIYYLKKPWSNVALFNLFPFSLHLASSLN